MIQKFTKLAYLSFNCMMCMMDIFQYFFHYFLRLNYFIVIQFQLFSHYCSQSKTAGISYTITNVLTSPDFVNGNTSALLSQQYAYIIGQQSFSWSHPPLLSITSFSLSLFFFFFFHHQLRFPNPVLSSESKRL